MSQVAFYLDGTRCTGCKTCVYACKDKYSLDLGQAFRRVFEYQGGETLKTDEGITTTAFNYAVSVACNHCNNAPCIENCPVGAMQKDADTGIVFVDIDTCIGCGTCASVCPYHAPVIDKEIKKSRKCDFCFDYYSDGKEPACVMACPARALSFGTVDEVKSKGDQANIAPLPASSQTDPNFYIKPSRDAKPADSKDGELANPLEVK